MAAYPYEVSPRRIVLAKPPIPRVMSIKMTMYRRRRSPIARKPNACSERGVQVAVLVELQARFDRPNVTWAKAWRAPRARGYGSRV